MRASEKPRNLDVHLVSEATGGLARTMAAVTFSQFPGVAPRIHPHVFCNTSDQLRVVYAEIAASSDPLVMAALTQAQLKTSLRRWCDRRDIRCIDLMGPIVRDVARTLHQRPVRDVSRLHRCDDEYFRRMDAWEFTLQHDDSRRIETAGEADIILLGISRVGKTPVSAYLGSLGYRVANVSLANGVPIPRSIRQHRAKTVGLTIRSDRLVAIRRRRFALNRLQEALQSRGERPSYYTPQEVLSEVEFAEQQFRKLRIRTLDMTDLTVEESASRILQMLQVQ